jgi:hypothetical protein
VFGVFAVMLTATAVNLVLSVARGDGLAPYGPVTRGRTMTFPIVAVVPAVAIVAVVIAAGGIHAVRSLRRRADE